jgi:hypothetical protein
MHAQWMKVLWGPACSLSKTFLYVNCPTPSIQNYINLRGLSNKQNFVHAVSSPQENLRLKIQISSRIRSRIQKGFTLWIRGPWGIVWWKKWRSKISWHCPFNTESNNFNLIYDFKRVQHCSLILFIHIIL